MIGKVSCLILSGLRVLVHTHLRLIFSKHLFKELIWLGNDRIVMIQEMGLKTLLRVDFWVLNLFCSYALSEGKLWAWGKFATNMGWFMDLNAMSRTWIPHAYVAKIKLGDNGMAPKARSSQIRLHIRSNFCRKCFHFKEEMKKHLEETNNTTQVWPQEAWHSFRVEGWWPDPNSTWDFLPTNKMAQAMPELVRHLEYANKWEQLSGELVKRMLGDSPETEKSLWRILQAPKITIKWGVDGGIHKNQVA